MARTRYLYNDSVYDDSIVVHNDPPYKIVRWNRPEQPFTVWRYDHVIQFTASYIDALNFIQYTKRGKN